MSVRRDALMFLAAALVPAAAVGWFGLRALQNEEAALRREAALEVSSTAQRLAGSIQQGIERGAEALSRARVEEARTDDDASVERAIAAVRATTPDFAEPVAVGADGRLLAPKPPSAERAGAKRASETCPGLADYLSATADERRHAAALDACSDARDASGRWVWPILALAELRAERDAALGDRLAAWIERNGAAMRAEEREATRLELGELGAADQPWHARATRALANADAGAPSVSSSIGGALRSEAALRARRSERPLARWEGDGAVGVLVPAGEAARAGFVVTPETLRRAADARPAWLDVSPSLAVDVVTATASRASPEQAPEATAWITDGLGLRVRVARPELLAARASRSRRLLGALVALSAAGAVGLAALLFARVRAARRTSELRTTFAAAVSHELRTPLASVRMLSELLADGKVAETEQKEVAEALAREARRMGDTVERFMAYARMERGKLVARRKREDVAEIVRGRVAAFRERRPGAEVDLDAPDALTADVDRAQIELSVDNLLENALKYAPDGGPYRVALRSAGGDVEIVVADRGPGVPAPLRRRIFLPFERGDERLSKATEGTGLGLALVRTAARAHGGDASLSDASPGATFVVRFPARVEHARNEA
jgi:two-component system phosphate regulon sensor histidine kinase PhoR